MEKWGNQGLNHVCLYKTKEGSLAFTLSDKGPLERGVLSRGGT